MFNKQLQTKVENFQKKDMSFTPFHLLDSGLRFRQGTNKKIALIAIIILGALLRIAFLNQSLWLDEATTALVSKMSLAQMFNDFLPNDFHPPLYYLILNGWVGLFGNSEISLRIPSVLFGLGTIYLVFLLADHFGGESAGVAAAALVSTSGLLIYYSQEARMYSMITFLVSLAFLSFVKKNFTLLSVVLMILAATNYLGLIIVPVIAVFGLKEKKFWLSLVPALIFMVVWSPFFINQVLGGVSVKETSPEWWKLLGIPSFKNISLIFIKMVSGRIGFENKILYFLFLLPYVFVYIYLLTKLKRIPKIISLWFIIPIAAGIIISFKIPVLSYFRFIFCAPALFLAIALVLSRSKAKFFVYSVLILVSVNLIYSGIYLFNPRFHREDWRSMVKYIENTRSPASQVVFPSNSNMEAYKYYAPDAKITGPAGVPGTDSEIWLVRYLVDVFDKDDRLLNRVESSGYKYSNIYFFRGITVLKYTRQ